MHSGNVTAARTLGDARNAVARHDRTQPRRTLTRAAINTKTLVANAALKIAQRLCFNPRLSQRRDFRNVVVYTVGILGDNVVMLPALLATRNAYPDATISLIVNCQNWNRSGATELFAEFPHIDHLHIVDDRLVHRQGARLILDQSQIPGVKCDLFINLSPFGNRGWLGAVIREIALAKLLGATYAAGFAMSLVGIGPQLGPIRHTFQLNEPTRARGVLAKLGIKSIDDPAVLPVNTTAKQRVSRILAEQGIEGRPIAVFHPGAKFKVKCWPAERFGSVARWLRDEMGIIPVLTGTAGESAIARQVVTASGGAAVDLIARTTVTELSELLRLSKLCVTNDTGTMHLACALGISTVAIFSTRVSPTHWFPNGSRVIALFNLLECSYCQKDNDDCDHISCLREITVGHVQSAISNLLAESAESAPLRKGNSLSLPVCPTYAP